MNKAIFLGIALLAGGCTKKDTAPIVCDVLFKSVTAAASGVAATLGCQNVPAVAAALSKPIMTLPLCSETASGLVGDAVCAKVVDTVMAVGLSQLPADWKCSGGEVGAKAKDLLTAKCKEAVPF